MATPVRRADSHLRGPASDNQCSFGFFQAVRLLVLSIEAERRRDSQEPPEALIRFQAHNSFAFPASELQRVERGAEGVYRVTINFLGLTGPVGVLPDFYTERLNDEKLAHERSGSDFLDIFNNRFAWLFYRAWEKHRVLVGYERGLNNATRTCSHSKSSAAPSPFSRYLLSLAGLGTKGLSGRTSLPDDLFVYYSGLLTQQPRCAVNLEGLLRDFLRVKVQVFQFEGAWVDLTKDSLAWLNGCGSRNQLGFGAVAGDRVWNVSARIRIRIGALSFSRYISLLPGNEEHQRLQALTRFFVDRRVDFALQLVLSQSEIPCCQLGSELAHARLGYSTWLYADSHLRDAEDLVVRNAREPRFS